MSKKNTLKSQALAYVTSVGSATSPQIAKKLWNGDIKKAEVTLYDLRASGQLAVRTNGHRDSREWYIPTNVKPTKDELTQAFDIIKRALGI